MTAWAVCVSLRFICRFRPINGRSSPRASGLLALEGVVPCEREIGQSGCPAAADLAGEAVARASVFEEGGTVFLLHVLTWWPVNVRNVLGPECDELSRVKVQALGGSRITIENAKVGTTSSPLHNDPKSIDAAVNHAISVPGFNVKKQFGTITPRERFTLLSGWDMERVRMVRLSVFGGDQGPSIVFNGGHLTSDSCRSRRFATSPCRLKPLRFVDELGHVDLEIVGNDVIGIIDQEDDGWVRDSR